MQPSEQHILIIDDDAGVAEELVGLLAGLGFTSVQCVSDGRSALDTIDGKVGYFDLILCDLEIPAMDGIELLRHLTQRAFGGEIVLMSGRDGGLLESVEGLGKRHELNMRGSLRKPVTEQALSRVLGHPLDDILCRPKAAAVLEITAQELATALGKGGLSLYYQPQVDVATERIVGVESLLRWNHPRLGPVSPMHFVARAEHLGLIDGLAEQVFALALAQGSAWRSEGILLKLSVNVTMQNLRLLTLPDQLAELSSRHAWPLESLTLEVRQSQFVNNPVSVLETLARLRMRGMGLSIDDFGSGYADLERLSEFPFTELKIDRCFVLGAYQNPTAMVILRHTVALAKKLGLKVVAEGVETHRHWELVKDIGCDLAQGYYIAKPMPSDQLLACLSNWNDITNTIKSAYDMALHPPVA